MLYWAHCQWFLLKTSHPFPSDGIRIPFLTWENHLIQFTPHGLAYNAQCSAWHAVNVMVSIRQEYLFYRLMVCEQPKAPSNHQVEPEGSHPRRNRAERWHLWWSMTLNEAKPEAIPTPWALGYASQWIAFLFLSVWVDTTVYSVPTIRDVFVHVTLPISMSILWICVILYPCPRWPMEAQEVRWLIPVPTASMR